MVETIVKMLSCGIRARGFHHYSCSNPKCLHSKNVTHSCSCRYCQTCGVKPTNDWINEQLETLPNCDWQHITLTMPDTLWPLFKDWKLLNKLPKLAADIFNEIAKKQKGIRIGMFMAIHTFGRSLNWNAHLHMSVTMGGINDKNIWKKIRFVKKVVMPMWRYRVLNLLREHLTQTEIDEQFGKQWVIHFAEPTSNPKNTIAYLGRYIRRPPISMSRLKHYDGKEVTFRYLDHKISKFKNETLDMNDFLDRFTQHIPPKGFRLIRYFGFLANCVRGKLLPKIYKIFKQEPKTTTKTQWAQLYKKSFIVDPLECILCGSQLLLTGTVIGLSSKSFMNHHEQLAKRKRII